MRINTNITMGNYSIELSGEVEQKDYATFIAEGLRSFSYRKVSPKLDVPIANHFGQSTIDKKGNPIPVEGFKKKEAAWDADVAPKIAAIYEKEYPGFKAKVTKYEATPAGDAAKVNKAKADLAVKLALEEITVEQFREEMKKLA